MINIILGSLIGVSSAWYLAQYNRKSLTDSTQLDETIEKIKEVLPPQAGVLGPVGTAIIMDYIEKREHLDQEPKQFVVYSILHKQPLSIHSLYTPESGQVEGKKEQYNKSKNQGRVEDFFAQYAQRLLGKCHSVQVIEGPIFRKDRPYKTSQKEGTKETKGSQIYSADLKINAEGVYQTDTFFDIVVCNTEERSYFSPFIIEGEGDKKSIKDSLADLQDIQKKTGLTFHLEGQPLSEIDGEYLRNQQL